jgi:hypothetical protein
LEARRGIRIAVVSLSRRFSGSSVWLTVGSFAAAQGRRP